MQDATGESVDLAYVNHRPLAILLRKGSIVHLIGAVLREANDEWALQHRYRQTEAIAQRSVSEGAGGRAARGTDLTPPLIDAVPTQIATVAA